MTAGRTTITRTTMATITEGNDDPNEDDGGEEWGVALDRAGKRTNHAPQLLWTQAHRRLRK